MSGGWFEQRRMEWIDETISIFGYINREHLCRKFRISIPQASLDIARFRRLHPGVITYDARRKAYVAAQK